MPKLDQLRNILLRGLPSEKEELKKTNQNYEKHRPSRFLFSNLNMDLGCVWLNEPLKVKAVERMEAYEDIYLQYSCPICPMVPNLVTNSKKPYTQVNDHYAVNKNHCKGKLLNRRRILRGKTMDRHRYVNQPGEGIVTCWACFACLKCFQTKEEHDKHFRDTHEPKSAAASSTSNNKAKANADIFTSSKESDDDDNIFQKPLPMPKDRHVLSRTKKEAAAVSKPLPRLKLVRDASFVRRQLSTINIEEDELVDEHSSFSQPHKVDVDTKVAPNKRRRLVRDDDYKRSKEYH